jgi:hypothetical protein
MRWVQAVKLWNSEEHTVSTPDDVYAVPRKGTSAYDEVRTIMTTPVSNRVKLMEPSFKMMDSSDSIERQEPSPASIVHNIASVSPKRATGEKRPTVKKLVPKRKGVPAHVVEVPVKMTKAEIAQAKSENKAKIKELQTVSDEIYNKMYGLKGFSKMEEMSIDFDRALERRAKIDVAIDKLKAMKFK